MKKTVYYRIFYLLFLSAGIYSQVNRMIFVKGGSFQMGSTEKTSNTPLHTITIDDFYISQYEVTQKEWKKIMHSNPSYYVHDQTPVHNVSWYDAVVFCNKKSSREKLKPVYKINKDRKDKNNFSRQDQIKWIVTVNVNANGYRLPTEAEWEYAARGGQKSRHYLYSGSNRIFEVAWFYENSDIGPQKIGLKRPNELGLYDMSGNIYEWCWDWYGDNYYRNSALKNPLGAEKGIYRVLRGGSWLRLENTCRVFYRRADHAHKREFYIGFRITRTKL